MDSRTAYRTEVEAAVLLARIGHYLTAVSLSQHNHGTAVALGTGLHTDPYGWP